MEEFDDTEMQDLGEKYPEYDDMSISDLMQRYNELIDEQTTIESENGDPTRLDEINEIKNYIERLQELKQEDTAVPDGQTVTIERSKTQRSNSAPEVPSIQAKSRVKINIRPVKVAKVAVQDFIERNYNIDNFRFDETEDVIRLRLNIKSTDKNNIAYRPLTKLNEMYSLVTVMEFYNIIPQKLQKKLLDNLNK